jgi:hypothetical protein
MTKVRQKRSPAHSLPTPKITIGEAAFILSSSTSPPKAGFAGGKLVPAAPRTKTILAFS